MESKGTIIIDKSSYFIEKGKVLFMNSIFEIKNVMENECIIENDNYGKLTILKNNLEQFYILEKETKEKICVNFDEYHKIKIPKK